MKQFLVPISLLFLALSLLAVLVRNAVLDTPAVRMKAFAKERETHVERTVWKPTPEQQQLLDEAARTHPDPISDDLVPVLAAIHKDYRHLVFFDKLESGFYLAARAWALRDGYVMGDPREVEMFVEILKDPPESESGIPSSGRNAAPRDYAFIAIQNVVLAGDPHRRRFPEFERLALMHIDSLHGDHALRLLYMLERQDGLSEESKQILAERTEKQWVRNVVSRYYTMQKNEFFRKD